MASPLYQSMKIWRAFIWFVFLTASLIGLWAFSVENSLSESFRHQIITDRFPAQRAAGDINGDGMSDLFVAVDAESGNTPGLYWLEYPTWITHTIAERVNFRGDDLESEDIDRDGDPDLVVTVDNNGKVYWYQNPGFSNGSIRSPWNSIHIGTAGGYVKDVEVADLNADGQLEIVIRTKQTVSIFLYGPGDFWLNTKIAVYPREGMDLGDLDGDGDLDLVFNGFWLETPDDLRKDKWNEHIIDNRWFKESGGRWQDNSANVVVEDMNLDGKADVLLCHAEKANRPIVWYESQNPLENRWIEHPIAESFDYCETLQTVDMDGDGDMDVVAGEMKKNFWTGDLLLFLNNDRAFSWNREVISLKTGIYDGLVADIGSDGDFDLIGCRDYNKPPVEWWENLSSREQSWQYSAIDDMRPESEMGKTGLVITDINRDGFDDVVAGSMVYLNPAGSMGVAWPRIELPDLVDIYFAIDVDGDVLADLIEIKDDEVYWLEAQSAAADSWKSHSIASVPSDRTQGYAVAQLLEGGKPELIFTRGKRLYYLKIPQSGHENGAWPLTLISEETEEEGVAPGDIDRDEDIDLVAVSGDGHRILWLENPGMPQKVWKAHLVGKTDRWSDRVELLDVNNDGRLDVVSTEETRDGLYNAKLYWFEGPRQPAEEQWDRHTVATLRSINSLDVVDFNGDGRQDIVVAEHTDQRSSEAAPNNLTLIYLNIGNGLKWRPFVVERGPHSSHLGAKAVDLNNDGVREIVSIGWRQYRYVHMWYKDKK